MITIGRVTKVSEIENIRILQNQNLRENISTLEAKEQGFLTASYTIDFLTVMHQKEPAIIAKDGDNVVGYALVAVQSIRKEHDLIDELFSAIDAISFNGMPMVSANYVVVGQLCVAKDYRGLGLVQKMYNHFRECLKDTYAYCATDVAQANVRSLKAHKKTGFQVAGTLTYADIPWDIVVWDWRYELGIRI
jgi:ribosomal protein S18 acetylase RimI-like enzyme